MSGNKFKNFLPVIFLFLILFPLTNIFAADLPSGGFDNPLKANDFTEIFVSIANWIAGIVATVAVLLIVIAGLQYIFSGGDLDRIQKAHKTIQWSLIGLIIVLMSWSLLNTVLSLLNVK
ncbi:MAG: hypothetical protein AUJ11_01690 [Parcubacteria group bacterium CG1_02_44_65]|uniref:TIGR03745 family integrating conjugative element membrane protein n=1 Tax=Candidatus Portnoybacteria bacterium CG10_big_fil_rev_8_21_14_0_10_43_39 TaxID=1974815 RepID=A0A2M8KI03_9BACT|nr:MAG: hypothetical protein AUJ11_01690 [Parcubacteria group bacterium CG1_02_44_65]PIP15837.1 MAG: hypothetical protein COX45_01025 [Candidatus Portnoybacteria bacterium CG23_combo_of_CG06-09_8_20_14_all_44_36]PJE59560.1 MAG: hypothetical protein COU84_00165 [Candidatus Portnoybacteria bacterium CG10_big_fil_rev_8_21_14_0_10_43_39]